MRSRPIPPGAIKIALPNVCQQRDFTCGAAAFAAVCAYFGSGPCVTEQELVDALGLVDERGTDPAHLVRAATARGLAHVVWRDMTDAQLRACLDRAHPVLITVQASGTGWDDGHWVVAIGYDADGIYVEDPLLYCTRGFVPWAALAARWHDIEGDDDRPCHRVGVELWRDGRAEAHAVELA